MDTAHVGALFLYFLMLAFVAVGGAPTVLPEMHRYVVDIHAWMTSTQFAELYTLAQVAPGPNVMYIPLIGWRIAGWLGAAATTIPFLVPSCTLGLLAAHLHARYPQAPFGVALRRGLTPITIGLIFSSGWVLASGAGTDWGGYALALVTLVVVLRTSLNPLWLLGAGALAGIMGVVQ